MPACVSSTGALQLCGLQSIGQRMPHMCVVSLCLSHVQASPSCLTSIIGNSAPASRRRRRHSGQPSPHGRQVGASNSTNIE